MEPNKILINSAVVVAIAMAGLFSAKLTTKVVAQIVAQNVTIPYSITFRNILTNNSGKQTELDSHTDEQRRNGDRSQLWPLPGGKTKRMIEFVSVGVMVSASDVNSNISTLGKGEAHGLIPNYTCLSNHPSDATIVGKEDILGWSTTHYSSRNASQILETWVTGSDLGCVTLKRVVQFLENGVATGSSDALFATKVVAGDPPDADFVLPANATEVSPSQFEGSINSPLAGKLSTMRMDAIYYNHKAIRDAALKH